MRRNSEKTILHNNKPKQKTRETSKFELRRLSTDRVQPVARLLWFFWMHFWQLPTITIQDLTVKCYFYCHKLFSDEKTERRKTNFAELQRIQATTELSRQINQSTIRCLYNFFSCTFCLSTGSIPCLSTQKTMLMNHESKINAIKSSFPVKSHL